ncbi:hypothetical protein CDL12_16852 [Handroanthus impetiginosus]|uniref:U2 snRNP splicing factor, small subunit n=1 Tax=Handroanthus impetiginosus TaxID=429701 RepID=A0A2G9GZA4_9LAMI|nr:hypothetical protein CDL12_16852 [Handroanthus impetiginosus]
MINEMEEERKEARGKNTDNNTTSANKTECARTSRKERRKAAKKEKRKKKRKEMAEMARREEEARLNDPEERLRLEAEEEREKLRAEKERREFEERERRIQEEWARRRAQAETEEEERRRAQEEEHQWKQKQVGYENELDEDGWEYVEEGPPEIIWQGNEIIVKKKKIRVKRKDADLQIAKEDPDRPTSNPLPPQSEAFADYQNASMLSAQQLLQNVAQETPNFGTEQDKAHCPFHLKTGACRFGTRCSRIHFYPDKSCTLLIKNMYNGPGLAWEQDEGLEYTDEEVDRAYEEFYEDVHTEFLKFGEIINFKVCRNGSSHLRGNVYVHYKSLDSAVLAYQSVNGRFFAGKQVQCEFVGVTRWKVAICGEFMKSKLRTCSRGTACNFIHCFRNPGGDYEWADWDKPPPKYWLEKMAALFGYSDESGHDKQIERGSSKSFRSSSRMTDDADRYRSRRSRSKEIHYSRGSRNYLEDDNIRSSAHRRHRRSPDRKQAKTLGDKRGDMSSSREKHHSKDASSDSDSDGNCLDRNGSKRSSSESTRNHSQACRDRKLESRGNKSNRRSIHEIEQNENMCDGNSDYYEGRLHPRGTRRHREKKYEIVDGNQGPSTRGDWSDEDIERAVNLSGASTNASHQNRASKSPDDDWDVRGSTYGSNLTVDRCDEGRESSYIYTDKSPRSDASDGFDHKKSKRQRTDKLKHSSIGDHRVRGNREVEHDHGNPTGYGRRDRSSDSSSRCYSIKDTVKLELGECDKQF